MDDELIPQHIAERFFDGENPIKVWREYRGMTQCQLASLSGITQAYISGIESGARTGTVATLKAVANSLGVTIDDLV